MCVLLPHGVQMPHHWGPEIRPDMVNHPPHYTAHPAGIEHLPFLRGTAIKYLWRAGQKGDATKTIEDLRKAIWYIEREIKNLEREA